MNTYLMYQDCSCFTVGRYSLFAGVSVHAVRYQSSFILLPRIRHAGAAHIMPAAHLLRGRVLLSCTCYYTWFQDGGARYPNIIFV
jgi:hypothetical protein